MTKIGASLIKPTISGGLPLINDFLLSLSVICGFAGFLACHYCDSLPLLALFAVCRLVAMPTVGKAYLTLASVCSKGRATVSWKADLLCYGNDHVCYPEHAVGLDESFTSSVVPPH